MKYANPYYTETYRNIPFVLSPSRNNKPRMTHEHVRCMGPHFVWQRVLSWGITAGCHSEQRTLPRFWCSPAYLAMPCALLVASAVPLHAHTHTAFDTGWYVCKSSENPTLEALFFMHEWQLALPIHSLGPITTNWSAISEPNPNGMYHRWHNPHSACSVDFSSPLTSSFDVCTFPINNRFGGASAWKVSFVV